MKFLFHLLSVHIHTLKRVQRLPSCTTQDMLWVPSNITHIVLKASTCVPQRIKMYDENATLLYRIDFGWDRAKPTGAQYSTPPQSMFLYKYVIHNSSSKEKDDVAHGNCVLFSVISLIFQDAQVSQPWATNRHKGSIELAKECAQVQWIKFYLGFLERASLAVWFW